MMLLSNADGAVVGRGRDYLERLVNQVARPVRWDLCMQTMADLGVTGLLELPPAGTLTGIAKRNLKGVELFSLNTPDQLEDARAFVSAHAEGGAADLAATPSWRMLVAPGKGQFHAEAVSPGTKLVPGTQVGAVHNIREAMPVIAPHGGEVIEWLVEDGDLVSPGQPIVRLHPSPEFSLED